MDKLTALKDNWPAAAVIIVFIAAFVCTAIFAPPETQMMLFGAEGVIATIFGIWLRSPKDRGGLVTLLAVGCAAAVVQGCGAGGVSAAILAAKPAIDASCHIARMSCAFVDTACVAVGSLAEEPSSGGEDPRPVVPEVAPVTSP